MNKLAFWIIVMLLILTVSACDLFGSDTSGSSGGSGSSASGDITRSYDGGKITLKGSKDQLDKIASVEIISQGDSRYPSVGQISGAKQIIQVFEIKPKSSGASVAPPRLTLDDLYVGQMWYNVQDKSQDLPIYRYDSGAWNDVIGKAWLKKDKAEHANGYIDHASLLAVVEEIGFEVVEVATEPPPPTESPSRTREQVIKEGVVRVVEEYSPPEAWIHLSYLDASYGEAVEITMTYFDEYQVPVRFTKEDSGLFFETLAVSIDAGEPPETVVLFLYVEQWDGWIEEMLAMGYEGPIFAYTEESGEPEWVQLY